MHPYPETTRSLPASPPPGPAGFFDSCFVLNQPDRDLLFAGQMRDWAHAFADEAGLAGIRTSEESLISAHAEALARLHDARTLDPGAIGDRAQVTALLGYCFAKFRIVIAPERFRRRGRGTIFDSREYFACCLALMATGGRDSIAAIGTAVSDAYLPLVSTLETSADLPLLRSTLRMIVQRLHLNGEPGLAG